LKIYEIKVIPHQKKKRKKKKERKKEEEEEARILIGPISQKLASLRTLKAKIIDQVMKSIR
jgi:hypothetical protein